MSLRLDSVQKRLASFITGEIETALEAPIEIQGIKVIHLDEVILNGILLRDQVGDTILYAEKATAHISPYKLIKNRIQINTLTVAAPDIRINRMSASSPLNIQFLIDKFKKDEQKEDKKFALRINQMLIYDGRVRYDIQDVPRDNDKFDPSHIDVDSIDCNISMKKFISEELDVIIRSIKGYEKSGIRLNKLKTSLKATEGNIILAGTRFTLPGSDVSSDSIAIKFEKGKPESLKVNGNILGERFTVADLAPLIAELPDGIPAFSFSISSCTDSISSKTEITTRSLDNNLSLKCATTIDSPYKRDRKTNIRLDDFSITKKGISLLQSYVDLKTLAIADKVGDFSMNGEADITSEEIKGRFKAETASGDISAVASYTSNGYFDIKANGENINISRITRIKEPLTCSLNAKADGYLNENRKNIRLNGCITELESSAHTFSPIDFSGEYDITASTLKANVNTADPGITAKINLDYVNDGEHRVVLAMDVDSISPREIGLSKEIEETFAFNFNGEFSYKDRQTSLLNVKLQNFTYRNKEEQGTIRNLHFCDNRTDEQRFTLVNSDFMNLSLIGQYDYKSIIHSLKRHLGTHAPSMFANISSDRSHCNYVFKCEIKESHFISQLLNLPIYINQPSVIDGTCNDHKNFFSINTTLNEVKIKKGIYNTIGFNANATDEALTIKSHIIKPVNPKNRESLEDKLRIDLNCTLFNDTIQNSLTWGNNKEKKCIKGELNMDAVLDRDEDNLLFVKANISPDSIVHNDSIWYISGTAISGNLNKIDINGLYLYNDTQHVGVSGSIGKQKEDILNIRANNLEVATIFDLIRFRILKFNGNATGSGQATALLSEPNVSGYFDVDSFKIDNGHLGKAGLNIGWRNSDKSIFLNAKIHNDKEDISTVDGFLSQVNDTIHLDIDAKELNAVFINKMVRSFLSDIDGTGTGKVSLLGKWREVGLLGSVALNCSARINPTKVKYTFHGDSLYFTSGKLSFNNAFVTDRYGNKGWLTGEVTHKNLGNWECDLSAKVENMLVYDTHNFDELPLYGTIYATGNANLKASKKGLFIKAEIRNEANSRIVYNSSEASGARDNSFVTFIDSSKKQADEKKAEEQNVTQSDIESSLNLDFLVEANEGLQVKVYTNLKSDDYIDLYGAGTVNAVYDEKEGFSLKGNMDLDRGTYKITIQDIFTKEFNITKGSSLLFNGDPFYATLDLKTKYLVPSASLSALTTEGTSRKSVKVNCLMDITGTLASPILKFDLELPEGSEEEKEILASATSTQEQKNMQFIYLLSIGKFYTYDYSSPLATNTQNTTAVESLISNTLSGQLNNMLGQIIDNGNWNISGNFSTSERGWNSMEVEGMLEGRLLNDRLLINGNLGYRENPVANRNVIGDFELQWLLNRKGTISLRAYSKTNDRYFSKTNLTTQGAGIILRHDFNSWRWWKKEDKEKVDE